MKESSNEKNSSKNSSQEEILDETQKMELIKQKGKEEREKKRLEKLQIKQQQQ